MANLATGLPGPNQGMYEAAKEGYMPKFFAKITKHGVPIRIMILQSSIVTVSALLITFTSGADADFAFNVSLAATTAQYLMVYMIMLIAYMVLKKKH
ncbi:putative glutamate/gamma-aminobutyrate antiporter [Lactobacillus helveticus]|uniref:amino acid permease n=1 Tax=Lactobacillus helveticus TaxID=1587 RepID=UPI001A0EDFEC|nr:putative glutamate/gamma-aminobutyrate antiporter [Lactobacillus helveticus]